MTRCWSISSMSARLTPCSNSRQGCDMMRYRSILSRLSRLTFMQQVSLLIIKALFRCITFSRPAFICARRIVRIQCRACRIVSTTKALCPEWQVHFVQSKLFEKSRWQGQRTATIHSQIKQLLAPTSYAWIWSLKNQYCSSTKHDLHTSC